MLKCIALCLMTLILLLASFTCSSVHASTLHPLLAHHHLCCVDVYCVCTMCFFGRFVTCLWFQNWKLYLFLEHQYQPVPSFLLTAAILVYPYLHFKYCLCTSNKNQHASSTQFGGGHADMSPPFFQTGGT